MDEIKNYPPYLDYPKPYKPRENINYIRAMSDEEALAASKSRMFMAKCTGMKCPMHVGYKIDECELKDCHYRTEPLTNADYFRAMSNEEQQNFVRIFLEIEDFADWLGRTI